MNRYEAQDFDLFAYNGDMTFINADVVGARINSIYDDFESRTCENCKHQNEGSSRFFCSKTKISFDIGGCGDFWESKDEK